VEPTPPPRDADTSTLVRFVLTPNRSLPPVGFVLLMASLITVSFVTGTMFLAIGAWPVPMFLGLDVAIVYLAFRLNYRSGRRAEIIEIDGAELRLIRCTPSGKTDRLVLNPYWVRVRLDEARDGGNRIALSSHGRSYAFAGFLNDDERRELAPALEAALVRQRGPAAG